MRKNILLSTYFTCFLSDSELTQHKCRKVGALMSKNAGIEKKEEYRKQQKATLRMLQSLPLRDKICITQELIDEAILQYGEKHIYLSFSSGKDSTVLSHIARIRYPNILHVFAIHPANIQKQ